MKAYMMVRTDLADTAEVQEAVDANPSAYTLGTIIVSADGVANMVTANDGSTVVLTAITNVPAP